MSPRRSILVAVVLAVAGAARAQILPPPPQPAGNPSTPAKELLGKALYWDEQLSSTRTVACGTCHVFTSGGSDPRSASAVHPGPDGLYGTVDDVHGSFGVARQDPSAHLAADPVFGVQVQVTGRKAPSPINAAYVADLFWDGRASTTFVDPVTNQVLLASGGALESQAAGPPVNAAEMSHVGRSWTDIQNDLPALTPLALATNVPAPLAAFVAGQTYAQLFQQVYGTPGVTPERILFAIGAYERTLVSDQSPFDRWLVGQYVPTPAESLGRTTFQALCVACHTDLDVGVLATGPVLGTYRNVGVRPNSEDAGRFTVTQNPADMGRFKVPGLRNVALRAPYFHNGSKATLLDVVNFYGRGGDFHQNQDPLIFSIIGAVSGNTPANLVAFLNTLTDPRVAQGLPPFDRPTLWSERQAQVPTTFGNGTAGSGGAVPRAIALSPGFLGNAQCQLGVDRAAPSAFALVAWDLFANQTPTVVLGHNVYLAQSPALVTAGIGFTQGSGAGGGYTSFTIALPANPSFAGISLFGQWLIADAAGPVGFASSDAFALPLW
ncbi:MAG: cytochrome c peroxidase [Planctomycetota bacterium]